MQQHFCEELKFKSSINWIVYGKINQEYGTILFCIYAYHNYTIL